MEVYTEIWVKNNKVNSRAMRLVETDEYKCVKDKSVQTARLAVYEWLLEHKSEAINIDRIFIRLDCAMYEFVVGMKLELALVEL